MNTTARVLYEHQEDFGILEEHIDENLFNLFEMTTEEQNARKKAVTMTEVDLPISKRLIEEWEDDYQGFSFNNGNQLKDHQNVFGDLPLLNEELAAVIEEPQPPNKDDILSSIMQPAGSQVPDPNLTVFGDLPSINLELAAPIKPRSGSDPRIDVTEDHHKDHDINNLSPNPMAQIEDPIEVVPEILIRSPGNDETFENVNAPVIQDPDHTTATVIEDNQLQVNNTEVDVPSDVVQRTEDEVPNDIVLNPVIEPKTKKRKRTIRHLIIDEETQIPMEQLKRGIEDYRDLLRCDSPSDERVQSRKQLPKSYSGLRLGTSLNHLLKDSMMSLSNISDQDEEVFVLDQPSLVRNDGVLDEQKRSGAHSLLNIQEDGQDLPDTTVKSTENASLLRNEGNLTESRAPSLLLNQDNVPGFPDSSLQVPETVFPSDFDILSSTRNDFPCDEMPEENINLEPSRRGLENNTIESGIINVPEETMMPPELNNPLPEEIHQPQDKAVEKDVPSDELLISSFVENVHSKLRPSNKGNFGDLLEAGSDAKEAALKFYSLLVANKKELLTCEQDKCYKDININMLM